MSRFRERDEQDQYREQPPSRPYRDEFGRAGGSSSSDLTAEERRQVGDRNERPASSYIAAELVEIIDQSAAGEPTMAQFLERLASKGVAAIPNIQSNGRLNGFSYRYRGQTIKGSTLGRAYTPAGLQRRKGVSYEPSRDDVALRQAVERAGFAQQGPETEPRWRTVILKRHIEEAAAGQPTLSEFVERLRDRGVAVIANRHSNGKLNGFSYRFRGITIQASALGRSYTPNGLQRRKGVFYDPARDDIALAGAADRVPDHERDTVRQHTPERQPDRSARRRNERENLSRDQQETLAEIGKFRAIAVHDLVRHRYAGNYSQFAQDMRVLRERGLADRRTINDPKRSFQRAVIVLTRQGSNYARKNASTRAEGQPKQQYYAGLVKPAEIRHDAGIYRMYQVERERIEAAGGRVRRVVLDYELKRNVWSDLNRKQDHSTADYQRRKEEIATENELSLVNGRIVFPDLRIEYETRDGEIEKVDLELASDQYKNSEVQQKRHAGLKIYGPDSAPRSPVLHDPEIVAGLISM